MRQDNRMLEAVVVMFFLACALLLARNAWSAEAINLDAIMRIESEGNPLVYNKRSGAVGLYQITPICLRHYNEVHKTAFIMAELYEPAKNKAVAVWYFGWLAERLTSVDDILIAYNFGIGNLRKYKKGLVKLPDETRDYLTKYRKYA